MKAPNKILILTDDNQLEFTGIQKINKEPVYVYKFIKSETKLGKETFFSEAELLKQLNYSFKII